MSYALSTVVEYAVAGGDVECVAVGDVSGDGRDDAVAVTASWAGDDGWEIVIWEQQEDGRLADPLALRYTWIAPVDSGTCGLALSDLNEDGSLDIAVAAPNSLTRLLSDGAGGFDGPYATADYTAWALAAADVDGDGHQDLLTTGTGHAVSWWPGDGTGRLGWPTITADGVFDGREDLAFADLTADGVPDAVILAYSGPLLQVFPGDGTGAFSEDALTYDPELDYQDGMALAVGDLTGDGRADALISGTWDFEYRLALYTQRPDGTLRGPAWIEVEPNAGSLQIADVDGDGVLDIALTHDGWDEVSVLFDHDGWTEEAIAEVQGQTIWSRHGLAVGDLSGDGCADLVLGAMEDGIEVLYGSGCVGGSASDIDADGAPDLADVCPDVADVDQGDSDGDGLGDACDPCPERSDDGSDLDGDGLGDACDACVATPNTGLDADGDGVDDACDSSLSGGTTGDSAALETADPEALDSGPGLKGSGCACTSAGAPPAAPLGWVGLTLLWVVTRSARAAPLKGAASRQPDDLAGPRVCHGRHHVPVGRIGSLLARVAPHGRVEPQPGRGVARRGQRLGRAPGQQADERAHGEAHRSSPGPGGPPPQTKAAIEPAPSTTPAATPAGSFPPLRRQAWNAS